MLEIAKELLSILEDKGFKAYIVGGLVRDFYLGKETLDVDICTNATPMDLKKIFSNVKVDGQDYGSVSLLYKGIEFEITTFRKEIKYENNRKPIEIKYIDSLDDDLSRRDFIINTLCIDSKGQFIDKYEGVNDLHKKIIRTVGDPYNKFEEDSLRILRAIRFATILDFKFDKETEKALLKYSNLVNKLSFNRIKSELDRIFISNNIEYGIKLLHKFEIDKHLGFDISSIVVVNDILGLWAQLDIDFYKWPFTRAERDTIEAINKVLTMKLDVYTLYKYGLYVFQLASKIKGENTSKIIEYYNELPIKKKEDINIDVENICKLLNKNAGHWIKDIINDVEKRIIDGLLENDEKRIEEYLLKKDK